MAMQLFLYVLYLNNSIMYIHLKDAMKCSATSAISLHLQH